MKLVDSRLRVQRYNWIKFSRRFPRRSGYCEDQGTYQVLWKEYFAFGLKVWRWEIDREVVPLFVIIQNATIGDCGWRSKFKEHIFGAVYG